MHNTTPFARHRVVALLVGALLVFNAAVAQAQSGRRIPKRPATSDPMPQKESEPPVTKPEDKKNDKPALTILLAKHMDAFVSGSDIYLNIVMDGFMSRVEKSRNIRVEPSGRDMNRKEAYDAAKASPDRYIVWFQLVPDSGYTNQQSTYNSQSYAAYLYIDYVVFTPGTGKTKTSGHVYQRTRGVGPVNMPMPGRTSAEYSLRNAGMELADQVLGSLDLNSPTTTPPTH